MAGKLRIVAGQINFKVGDTSGNLARATHAIQQAKNDLKADMIVFPELAITGYPPEDLLFRSAYLEEIEQALDAIAKEADGIVVVIGHPEQTPLGLCNALSVYQNQALECVYHKHFLPNSQVFDEKRYFEPGRDSVTFDYKGATLGLIICEDVWHSEPLQGLKNADADAVIVINASPFSADKLDARHALLKAQARTVELPIIYVNMVGGQDELVFDGGSFAVNAQGQLVSQAPLFEESLWVIECDVTKNAFDIPPQTLTSMPTLEARIYEALVMGVRDYYQKNHFPGIVLGLSGGIDSALTLAIAVDAVGAENIEVLLMPSRFTSDISNDAALEQAKLLGVRFDTLSIEKSFEGFLETLADRFKDTHPGITEQNIQARCRGILTMAVSNKTDYLVLTTGNKSEYAVGYSTLYGDMCGGYAPLKDVYKTMVYQLAHFRNSREVVIPQIIIDRPPSAELAQNQLDSDSLPAYPLLDEILVRYLEHGETARHIIDSGVPEGIVHDVIKMIYRNEYKRRQAPPGPKVTVKAFGRDRRYPITSGFKEV